MAGNASNYIEYMVAIPAGAEDALASIRNFSNLKVANEDGLIWIKDFTAYQINTTEVKSMPFLQLYELRDNTLFAAGSKLPLKKAPSLLWTPIMRAVQVSLPITNSNYFGLQGAISCKLIQSEKERPVEVLVCSLNMLAKYTEAGYDIRFRQLHWVLFGSDKALVMGKPLLPLKGDTYWIDGNFLIPAGYEFEFALLNSTLDKKINPDSNCWILWYPDNSYTAIDKTLLKSVSLSSVRSSAPYFNKLKQASQDVL